MSKRSRAPFRGANELRDADATRRPGRPIVAHPRASIKGIAGPGGRNQLRRGQPPTPTVCSTRLATTPIASTPNVAEYPEPLVRPALDVEDDLLLGSANEAPAPTVPSVVPLTCTVALVRATTRSVWMVLSACRRGGAQTPIVTLTRRAGVGLSDWTAQRAGRGRSIGAGMRRRDRDRRVGRVRVQVAVGARRERLRRRRDRRYSSGPSCWSGTGVVGRLGRSSPTCRPRRLGRLRRLGGLRRGRRGDGRGWLGRRSSAAACWWARRLRRRGVPAASARRCGRLAAAAVDDQR